RGARTPPPPQARAARRAARGACRIDRDLRLDGAQSREPPRVRSRQARPRAPASPRDRGADAGAGRGRRGRTRGLPRARTGLVPSLEERTRERLPPEIFDLPVEKMREGYYADAYFNHARATLLQDARRPRVVMQV